MLAKRLTDQALDAIAADGVTDDAGGNRKSKAWRGAAGAARENREKCVGEAARITIDAIEFGFLPEALRRFERPRRCLQVERRTNGSAAVGRALLDREALAALRTAASEHLTPRAGGHARAKAVGALTTDFAGLISALHAGSLNCEFAVRARFFVRRKTALKQIHGGLKRRAARVRSKP